MARIIFLLGGARSGKSTMAERLGKEYGGDDVLFVATAEVGDEEMRRRVEAHRDARPRTWRTLEAPRDVAHVLSGAYRGERAIIIDCITLLVANLLEAVDNPYSDEARDGILEEIQALIAVLRESDATVILVSNEVGMGLVPPYPLGRAYRDILGLVNQYIAAVADDVYLIVAGIPLFIKSPDEK